MYIISGLLFTTVHTIIFPITNTSVTVFVVDILIKVLFVFF